ncbi:hypothetical protein [uncultured Phascolarctobacterium sp.]|uniref:hypothetical protein n=1 Tax=uncultured Phascolarctobacterium sp. TaxID=512296 RepID=UPI00262D4477|nr:hypothetical protein [uncultured Phascolarctobacterium sp.]
MKCGFCGREVDKGVVECPYCHYRFEIDAQVLSPNERDTFEGVTIEEDGTTTDNKNVKDNNDRQYRESNYSYQGYNRQGKQQPNIKVHSFGCGSSILMTLLILGGVLTLVFFLLPTFIVFAAIGAVVVFILRLFM